MAETDQHPTLCFTASLPLDGDFAPTAAELASRLALSAGLGEDDANAIGRSVEAAFTGILNGQAVDDASVIDVALCAGDATLDLSVSCGSTAVLTLSRPRP
jgi:hypothetical protein